MDDMAGGTAETLNLRREGGVLFAEIAAPPMNLLGPALVRDLVSLIRRAEADDAARVLVFKSADPDYFISHVDVTRIKEYREEAAKLVGEASIGLLFRHLSVSRLVTIAQIEGRVRAAGNEFVLACDMRFAAKETAIFSQPEPALGQLPGAGGAQHLARLLGRARALEVMLSAQDYDADLAERYGWINRALPAAALGGFVRSLAHRIASFPTAGQAVVKDRVNAIALAPIEDFRRDSDLFGEGARTPRRNAASRLHSSAASRHARPRWTSPGCWATCLPIDRANDSHLEDAMTKMPEPNRRTILTATAAFGALALAASAAPARSAPAPGAVEGSDAIRPFRIEIPEDALVDLRRRLAATRWPDQETDQSQGVRLASLQQLARYWETQYDWRKVEARLNGLPQFVTRIDGLDIQFAHVRSRHTDALPLIMTHGWPGSVVELLGVVEPLTNPTAHGGRAEDAFHLVLPSMPGYGFSEKPPAPGWNPDRIARAWAELMKRLGYTRYVAQGGDWGSPVSGAMARQNAAGLVGVHLNLPATLPPELAKGLASGEPAPAGLSPAEKAAYEQIAFIFAKGSGYAAIMRTRPQTVGYGLTDSPVGLAAWMIDHDGRSYTQIAQLFAGGSAGGLTRDAILDNVTLYWLTNTAISSGRLYWEYTTSVLNAGTQKTADISLPVAVSVFPGEIYRAPRSWTERAYRNLIYFNEVEQGGHFAAWEQPELFSVELRAAFKTLR